MQISLPGDRISELLHVVLIEICQKIISYTNELVVTGAVSVTADGIEVCRVPFDDCINKGESGTYGSGDKITRKTPVPETGNVISPVTFDHNGIGSSGSAKGSVDLGDLEEERSGVNTVECVVPVLPKVKNHPNCHFTTTRNALMGSDKNCRDLDKIQSSSSVEIGSLAGNLHEIIMEYWERITPELLRASELLCRLGEIQHLVGNSDLTVDDCCSTSLNLHRNFKKCNNNFDKESLNSCSRSDSVSEESGSSPLEFQPPMSVCQADSKCHACRRAFTDLCRHKKKRKFHAMSCRNVVRSSKISPSCSSTGVVSFMDSRNTIGIAKVPAKGGCVRPVEMSFVQSVRNLDRQAEQGAAKADRDVGAGTLTAGAFQSMEDAKRDTNSSASGLCLEKELEVCDDVDDDDDSGAGHKGEYKPAKDVNSSVSEDDNSALFESGSAESLKASISTCVKGNGQRLLNSGRNQDARKMNTSVDINGDNTSNMVEESCSSNATFTNTSSEALSLTIQSNPGSNAKVSLPESLTSTDVLFKTKKFDCSMCKASFSMLSNLQRHVRKIHGTTKDSHSRSVPAFEPVLDVLNVEPVSDLRTSRSSRYRHICVFCDAAFTFRTNLTRHMKKIHGKIPIDVADQPPAKSQPVK